MSSIFQMLSKCSNDLKYVRSFWKKSPNQNAITYAHVEGGFKHIFLSNFVIIKKGEVVDLIYLQYILMITKLIYYFWRTLFSQDFIILQDNHKLTGRWHVQVQDFISLFLFFFFPFLVCKWTPILQMLSHWTFLYI